MLAIQRSSVAVLLSIGVAGCATTTQGAQPDDMSAEAHREVASEHDDTAQDHEAQYDPAATTVRPTAPFGGVRGSIDEAMDYGVEYNMTEWHTQDAARHRVHAEQHRAAAEALEGFEAAECTGIPAEDRSACPLLDTVSSSENIAGGVRIHLAPGASPEVVLAHMRCHYAYGRTVGREGMNHCPMYLKGLKIVGAGKDAIDITTEDESAVEQLRKRTVAHTPR